MAEGWKPLVGVGGVPADQGPYEGVPDHLEVPLDLWARSVLGQNGELVVLAATTLRIELSRGLIEFEGLLPTFWTAIGEDRDLLLQLVHFLTYNHAQQMTKQSDYEGPKAASVVQLERLLRAGGSIWTVAADASGLMRRVDATTKEQYVEVVSSGDAASIELIAAWGHAYSFKPDPSDCWDHCIKALEELLKPIVTPGNTAATLGGVLHVLTTQKSAHSFALRDNGLNHVTDPYDTLRELLRLVWPNPDRHGGPHSRVPTVDEARGVLATTITIAQWAREGLIK